MNDVNALVSALVARTGSGRLVAVTAYPRNSETGHLGAVGAAIDQSLDDLRVVGGAVFRVMHAIGVGLSDGHESVQSHAALCAKCATADIEVRMLVAALDGPRDAVWLEELLGELSLRSNFGSSATDSVTRFIDGRPFTPASK